MQIAYFKIPGNLNLCMEESFSGLEEETFLKNW